MVEYNPETGETEITEEKELELQLLLTDALKVTEVRPDFEPVRAYFENKILELYMKPDMNQLDLEDMITKYTQMRMKDCMLREGFANKVKSHNGHIYLKALKEQIVKDLNLDLSPQAKEFSFEGLNNKMQDLRVDLEGKYNTAHINNLTAMGYDNFEQRLKNSGDE